MLLSTLFPAAFPALVIAHFVALLSPGQDFFLIIGYSIRHKLPGSRFICLGVALGNAIYIAIAVIGWAQIRDNPIIFSVVEIVGAIYLFWVGIKLLNTKKIAISLDTEKDPLPSIVKQLLLGLNSALLNPKNAIFYMSLMTVILGSQVTLVQQITCGVWMFLAVLLWDFLIAAIIGQPYIQKHVKDSVHLVERGAGLVLICFSLVLIMPSVIIN